MNNKNILITGGAGFIGSHLAEKLFENNAHIFVTDIEINPLSYFAAAGLKKKVVFIKHDIRQKDSLFKLIKKNRVEIIFHLAAYSEVEAGYATPSEALDVNIMGTVNVLECARRFGSVKVVIVASSDKAYGKLGRRKYKETDSLVGDHPYEVSKSAADLICSSYFKSYQTPVIVTRFGNVYGEGDFHFSRLVPGIMESLILKKTLPIRSDGKYIRDYIYIKDVVNAYLLLAANHQKVVGGAFNFGSTDTLSVLQVLKIIEKSLKLKIKYQILNIAKNEIPFQSLDYSKIKKVLCWQPKGTMAKTVEAIYHWYQTILTKKDL